MREKETVARDSKELNDENRNVNKGGLKAKHPEIFKS